MSDEFPALRKALWHSYHAMEVTLRRLQACHPMVQGSFYLLRRKCGKPNCHCVHGERHGRWVITRSEQGKERLYSVPKEERGRLRELTAEYRRYQRARAVLIKRQRKLVELIDLIAEKRLINWPEKKVK